MSNHLQVVEQQKPTAAKQQQPGMIMPAASVEDAVKAFNAYQELKERLGNDDDFQKIGGKKHPKKSFVRKVQRFFNVSCEIIQDEPLMDPKTGKIIAWLAKARAIHLATGAFQEADGSCGFEEKVESQRTIHNIRAHAITRAKNRAILDLVGFGDVSAEEIGERVTTTRQTYQQAKPKRNGSKSDEQEQIQRGRKKVRELTEEKNLTDEQLKKIIKHQTKEKKDDLNKLDVLELRDLVLLMQQMSRTELLNLIGEADVEVIDIDPEEGNQGGQTILTEVGDDAGY